MLFVQTTCGSIFRLTASVNMLQWSLKNELHRPTSRINRFNIGKQTIVKLSTIVSIASTTIVIVKKALSLSTSKHMHFMCTSPLCHGQFPPLSHDAADSNGYSGDNNDQCNQCYKYSYQHTNGSWSGWRY